jgi:hypothetical protein
MFGSHDGLGDSLIFLDRLAARRSHDHREWRLFIHLTQAPQSDDVLDSHFLHLSVHYFSVYTLPPFELVDIASRNPWSRSGEDLVDNAAVHVGKAAIDAVVTERESFVVDAQQVQDRRMQVIAIDLILSGLP